MKFLDIKKNHDIIYIIGPTGIGKSDFAIKLAQKIDSDIISADSYQVYVGMDIGTAKISKEDQKKVPHHLIDIVLPDQEYTVIDFLDKTQKIIEKAKKNKKKIIICGGSGLFINAFTYQYTFPKAKSNPDIRQLLLEEYEQYGKRYLWDKLAKYDLESSKKIHPNNKHHLLRALEIYMITKKPASLLKQKKGSQRKDTLIIGLTDHRSVVTERINKRVDNMINKGLIKETKQLLDKGYEPALPALKCIGYQESIDYLKGRITFDKMLDLIKSNTRKFSKRQMTWYKKIKDVTWNFSN